MLNLMKIFTKKEATVPQENLVTSIKEVKEKLAIVSEHYNIAEDNDLVEALIYEEKSLKARYDYLIKQCKTVHCDKITAKE